MPFYKWQNFVRDFWRKQEGQTMAEYGIVLALIAVGGVLAFTALSGGISNAITNVVNHL